jgi:hypothetical protein
MELLEDGEGDGKDVVQGNGGRVVKSKRALR